MIVRVNLFAFAPIAIAALSWPLMAQAGGSYDLPEIKVSSDSKVEACVTPGRLMAYTKARNEKLDAKFEGIATEYMRHGEALGVRWDIAYFQMLVETGSLKFGGDVRPAQNNFAGLGATGNGEHGESFKDVSTGVQAHLEHVLMYAGEKIANPAAERTRKVQEWGVLTEWQKTIKGPMTFTHLARKWAPSTRKYAAEIGSVAESFMDGPCKADDPNPERVAAARGGKTEVAEKAPIKTAELQPAEDKVSGAELAKQAIAKARSEGGERSGLGAASVAKGAVETPAKSNAKPMTTTLLNPGKPETAPSAAAEAGVATKTLAPAVTKGAGVSASKPGACKVFTASYGGTKAVIIKASTGEGDHYTVLDVNEGSEAREADAYIAAYAPGGKQVGEFPSEAKALDKAFDLCPEG